MNVISRSTLVSSDISSSVLPTVCSNSLLSRDSSKTCNLESYAIVKRNTDTSYNMNLDYEACLKCSNYKSPACSNSISGIKRLRKDASCEVK